MNRMLLAVLFPLLMLTGCSMSKSSQQKSPLASPSGTYTLKVEKHKAPGDGAGTFWYPEIVDQGGDRIYRDGTGFPSTAELSWAWDEQDRVWIYSTESESVDVIEKRADMGGNFWRRVWTGSHPCAAGPDACPPLSIYPAEVKKRIEEKGR